MCACAVGVCRQATGHHLPHYTAWRCTALKCTSLRCTAGDNASPSDSIVWLLDSNLPPPSFGSALPFPSHTFPPGDVPPPLPPLPHLPPQPRQYEQPHNGEAERGSRECGEEEGHELVGQAEFLLAEEGGDGGWGMGRGGEGRGEEGPRRVEGKRVGGQRGGGDEEEGDECEGWMI